MREGSKMKIKWQEVRHEGMTVFWLGFSESGTHIATIRTKQTQKGFRWVLEITQAHVLGMRQLESKMGLGEVTLEPWKPREVGFGQAEYLTRQAEAWFQMSVKSFEGLGW